MYLNMYNNLYEIKKRNNSTYIFIYFFNLTLRYKLQNSKKKTKQNKLLLNVQFVAIIMPVSTWVV